MIPQDKIIEWAREAGMHGMLTDVLTTLDELTTFANLVAQHQQEQNARLLESRKTGANKLMDTVRDMEAAAMRSQG